MEKIFDPIKYRQSLYNAWKRSEIQYDDYVSHSRGIWYYVVYVFREKMLAFYSIDSNSSIRFISVVTNYDRPITDSLSVGDYMKDMP